MTDPNFEEKVKISFLKVKEDISRIENEIKLIKDLIKSKEDKISHIFKKIENFSQKKDFKEDFNQDLSTSSSRNEGVCAHMQTHMRAHVHINPNQNIPEIKGFDSIFIVDKMFLGLTKKEFLIFLTIYQLQEDIEKVTYEDIATHLKLTPGCIRTHIGHIIKKDLPVLREKINNKTILLSISEDFRRLNLKSRLINLYHNQDPFQKKLI